MSEEIDFAGEVELPKPNPFYTKLRERLRHKYPHIDEATDEEVLELELKQGDADEPCYQ